MDKRASGLKKKLTNVPEDQSVSEKKEEREESSKSPIRPPFGEHVEE
jgi:hypothetical protein